MTGIILVICGAIFALSWNYYSEVYEAKDWHVYVKSSVINTLNSQYDTNLEKMYCVNGNIDENNKKVTITTITPLKLAYNTQGQAASEEMYPCKGQLGMIHTHPKYSGMPQCLFSELDFFTTGVLYGENRNFLGGVYCDKDKVAFYLTGSDAIGNLLLNNSRIGYTKIT